MKRIPLSERLENIGCSSPKFLAVFEMYPDYYFKALSLMTCNNNYWQTYEQEVLNGFFSDKPLSFMSKFITLLNEQMDDEAEELMYQTLIVPFAQIAKEKERQK